MTDDAYRSKGLSSAVSYQDPKAAYRWLERAFGFEPLFVLLDRDGNLAHSEMRYGDSVLMVGSEWGAEHQSPRSVGGKNTQSVQKQKSPSASARVATPLSKSSKRKWLTTRQI